MDLDAFLKLHAEEVTEHVHTSGTACRHLGESVRGEQGHLLGVGRRHRLGFWTAGHFPIPVTPGNGTRA